MSSSNNGPCKGKFKISLWITIFVSHDQGKKQLYSSLPNRLSPLSHFSPDCWCGNCFVDSGDQLLPSTVILLPWYLSRWRCATAERKLTMVHDQKELCWTREFGSVGNATNPFSSFVRTPTASDNVVSRKPGIVSTEYGGHSSTRTECDVTSRPGT